MIRHITWALALTAVVAGCHRPEDYRLGPSDIDRVLGITLSSTVAPADGTSRVTITAQLDPRTDADKRDVTFTTTAGTLVAGNREGPSLVVPADSTGKAVAELRSPVGAATAELAVSVASIVRTSSVAFLALAREEVFDVSVDRTTLPADGFSTAVITARLRRLGTLQQRLVEFETSAGTLIASGQASSRAVSLTADSTGTLTVELRSDKTPGTARIRVTCLAVPYEFTVTFSPVDPAQIIRVSTDRASAPADGVTPIGISATVAPGLPDGRRLVTFFSTLGQLIPGSVVAGSGQTAHTHLLSTATGVARITATVDGTSSETTAQFTPALPDRLQVSLDAAQLSSGGIPRFG